MFLTVAYFVLVLVECPLNLCNDGTAVFTIKVKSTIADTGRSRVAVAADFNSSTTTCPTCYISTICHTA
ncbi:MAG: hypothetical protein H6667_18020 [Ardenticatenaceae bacterium]|nr:hypothetical protein [Ardenticatenaceae bacterium]